MLPKFWIIPPFLRNIVARVTHVPAARTRPGIGRYGKRGKKKEKGVSVE